MKTCEYCGRENEQESQRCAECGTVFAPEPGQIEAKPPRLRELSGWRATIILLIYFGTQFGVGMVVAIVALGIGFATRPGSAEDPNQIARIIEEAMPFELIFGFVFSGIAVVLAPLLLIREHLGDRSPTGAAWVPGTPKAIAQGLVAGLIVGSVVCAASLAVPARATRPDR